MSRPTFHDVSPDGRRFAVVRGVQMGTSDVLLADGAFARAAGEKPGAATK
jgi:hypothetical protein